MFLEYEFYHILIFNISIHLLQIQQLWKNILALKKQ
jgi:hypothetical protein